MPEIRAVISDGLNLRSSPSISGQVFDSLPKGDVVEVLSRSDATQPWLHVKVRRTGQHGYVNGKYLSEARPDTQPAPAPLEPMPMPAGQRVHPLVWVLGVIVVLGTALVFLFRH